MKFTIKNLKQVTYEVEVDTDEETVLTLKKRIEEKHGFNHETFKLVFNQHILDNAKQLKEYNLLDGNVIIMMNSTVKPKPKEPEPEKKKEEDKKPDTTTTTNTNTTNTTTTVKKEEQPKPQRVEKNYDKEVNDLVDMGFSKEEAKACIKAARGNLSLAVEFLGSGIPDNLPPEDMDLGSGSGGQGQGQGQEQTGDRQSQTTALLKNIASIVKVISQNDETQLANMLQAVEQSDPALFNLISENQDQFKKLITEPVSEEDLRAFNEFSQRGQLGRQGGSGQTGGQRPRQDGKIPVTKDEMDAINRLKAFGFSEMDVVQAYFACDKSEELAINLLFDNKAKESGDDMNIDYSQFTDVNPNQGSGQSGQSQEKPKESQEKPKESSETQQKKEDDKPSEEKPKEESHPEEKKKDDESK